MLYREMPKNGDNLSILGFGCMRLPGSMMNPDEKKSVEQIRYVKKINGNLDLCHHHRKNRSEKTVFFYY